MDRFRQFSTILRYKLVTPPVRSLGTVVVGLVFVGVLGTLGRLRSRYDACFMDKLNGPLKEDDVDLIQYIKDQVLVPPSTLPYNLGGPKSAPFLSLLESEKFYRDKLTELFHDKEGLFFVEAGALDGEAMSNTLNLEQYQGWSGLLVEADAKSFAALQSKNRKAWSANVCLSPVPYPSQKVFRSPLHHHDDPRSVQMGYKSRSMNGLAAFAQAHDLESSWFYKVQCMPLQSLLLALNVSTVDLLVLDIEGAEMDVLKNLDLHRFNVQVIFLEWWKIDEMLRIIKKMKARGYLLHSAILTDIVLVKKGSPYEKLINQTVAEMTPADWKDRWIFAKNNLPRSVR